MIYLDLMQNQNMIHLAVQESDFDSRLYAWLEMLPLYFATSQVNYARFGLKPSLVSLVLAYEINLFSHIFL